MTNNSPVLQPTAMPAQKVPNYPDGANSPMTAGVILQQQQIATQQKLINPSGGRKRKRRIRGGQPGVATNAGLVIIVPSVPAGSVNPTATGNNYEAITKLAQVGASQAVYDNAQTPAATAAIAVNQKGGSGSLWGCLSGGKKYRKSRKSRKISRKSRKNRKTKRRHS